MPGERDLPHLRIDGSSLAFHYTSVPQQGAAFRLPPRQRAQHAAYLLSKLDQAWKDTPDRSVVGHQVSEGIYLEFKSSPGFELKIKSLEDFKSKKIRLCNVRKRIEVSEESGQQVEKEVVLATVFVAHDKKQFFYKKVQEYATKQTKTEKSKNADLVEGIDDLQRAVLQSFWVDEIGLIPSANPIWVEVWLRGDSDSINADFTSIVVSAGITQRPGKILFPERTVRLVYANASMLNVILERSAYIAEFRKAKGTADFWLGQTAASQADWVEELSQRISVNTETNVSICLLDTGVASGHPLLTQFIDQQDCLCVLPNWGSHDHKGHGTKMAGLAAFGNLQNALECRGRLVFNHRLESVKIVPPPPSSNSEELWGEITAQGVSLAEINSPARSRILCMAVMADDTRDRGRPTSWSAAIDKLASGVDDSTKRLFVLSAGNSDVAKWANYPDSQLTDSIHDPGQSWNALTVGAFTQLTLITDQTYAGLTPIAAVDQLSPFTTTSLIWQKQWPIKPEVVFEGGNAAVDSTGFATECNDLSLLSTQLYRDSGYLAPFSMTSAAAAQAANFAAIIQQNYPDYWPETVRALIVHSAQWPDALKNQFVASESKAEIHNLLRACGYGVPNIERALHCASNSLTLVGQATIQPFEMIPGSQKAYKTKDMHLYQLPWPIEELRNLGEVQVEMRITLSYFVEPGPGEVGWKDRYRYPSHLLRFDLNSPGEGTDEFVRRINAAVRDDENGHPGTQSAAGHWVIGSHSRDKGSIHSDIWKGTAAELAGSNLISVSPRIGWWRERAYLGKFSSEARYSLIVSITTPSTEVDIYTPVAQLIAISRSIEINTRQTN